MILGLRKNHQPEEMLRTKTCPEHAQTGHGANGKGHVNILLF